MRTRLRKTVFFLHLVAGLGASVVLLTMALSGSMLVFRPELDRAFNPQLFKVSVGEKRLPLDAIVAAGRRAFPTGKVDFVRFYGEPDLSFQVSFSNKDIVFVDPYTGRVLGVRNRYAGFFGQTERLHRFLLLGHQGELITGSSAMIYVFMFGTGIWLWLPRTLKALKASATFNPSLRGRARQINLHKVIGIYAGVIVLLSALTGLPQAFEWYKDGLYKITGSPLPPSSPKSTVVTSVPRISIEAAAETARRMIPAVSETLIHIPLKAEETYEMNFIGSDASHSNARTYLYLYAYSGEVLTFLPYSY